MKPTFALDLRDEQVTLLHRTARGWLQIGGARFDAPDLAEALAYMRSTALGLSPQGITTKLIIPNEQILYSQVTAPGPDAARRKRQVKAALEGLTPYAVDEIIYDTFGSGPDLQVAVIARQTLEEAEAFAVEHRFNPVSFVAVPDDGRFLAEPFFGPSTMASTLLAEGDKVQRDSEPVSVVTRELPRRAEPPAAAEPAPAPVPAAPPTAMVPPEPELDLESAAQPGPGATDTEAETKPEPESEPDSVSVTPPTQGSAALTEPPAPTPDDVGGAPAPGVMDRPLPPEDAERAAPREAGASARVVASGIEEAPMALDVQPDDSTARPPAPSDLKRSLAALPIPTDDLPPAPADTIRAALAARRAQGSDGAPGLGAATSLGAAAGLGAATGLGGAPTAGTARPASPRPVGAIETGTAKASAAAAAARNARSSVPGKALKGMGAMVTAPGIAGVGRRRPTGPASPADPLPSTPRPSQTGRPLTGLGGRQIPGRGRPRYLGLILTGVLLVFLALIAAWSSFFMAGLNSDQSAPASTAISQAAPPADAASPKVAASAEAAANTAATPADATPSAADEAAADGQDANQAAASEQNAGTAAATDQVAALATAAPPDAGPLAAPADATAAPAASAETTSAAAAAPQSPVIEPAPGTVVSAEAAAAPNPGSTSGDEIFLAAVESAAPLSDPVALPALAAQGDAAPQEAPAPPPFGTVYQFDAQGRIQPTPDGIVTPEGVRLVAGKPKIVPAARPAAIAALAPPVAAEVAAIAAAPAPAPALEVPAPVVGDSTAAALPPSLAPPATPLPSPDAAPASAATGAAATPGAIPLTGPETAATLPPVEPAAPFPSDPALKDFRPKDRPAGLNPVVAPAGDQAAPDASQSAALAGVRPRPRSSAPAALAAAASPSASTAGLPDATPTAQASASSLAVDASRLPAARPAALADAVNAAVQSALAQPAAQASGSASDGSTDAEPEVNTPAPSIPTKASVAKTATEKNALAGSKVVLIGVFGSDAARYAYVRLANGTLKKVRVGDQMDGGTVVAISASDLRYQKNGTVILLTLPRGG